MNGFFEMFNDIELMINRMQSVFGHVCQCVINYSFMMCGSVII